MNKYQKRYLVFWSVLLVLFQVIAFVSPEWLTQEKYTASFWIGYVLIMICFAGQLVCAWVALREEDRTRLFYKLPLIRVSYAGLIVSFVTGGACMLVSALPYWIGAIIAAVVLAATALAVIKADTAAELVADIDDKVKKKTCFIRDLTMEAEGLILIARTPQAKAVCKKVYEALRYSDPMSSEALARIESEIGARFGEFSETVRSGTEPDGEALLLLIMERNRKCKALK